MPQPEKDTTFAPLGQDDPRNDPRVKRISPKLKDVADAVRTAHDYQDASIAAFAAWDQDHWALLLAAVTSGDDEARMMVESMAQLNAAKVLALANVLVRFGWSTAMAEQSRPKLTLVT